MKIKTSELEKHPDDKGWYYISDEYAEFLKAAALLMGGDYEADSTNQAIRYKEFDGYILYRTLDPSNASQEFMRWQINLPQWKEYFS